MPAVMCGIVVRHALGRWGSRAFRIGESVTARTMTSARKASVTARTKASVTARTMASAHKASVTACTSVTSKPSSLFTNAE